MAGAVINSRSFISGLEKSEERFEKMFRDKVRTLVTVAMRKLIEKTPVNTGEAVMNYVASAGSPSSAGLKKAPDPVEPTNDLALGMERLRPAAEAVAMASAQSVDTRDPFQTFWIVNRTPHIGGLEHGLLPYAPYTPRSPAGMFGVTVQELMLLLSSGKI